MTILVTGGAGYVGSILVPLLLEKGHTVRVLDALLFGGGGLLPVIHNPNLEFIHGDVRKPETVKSACIGVDAVVHLAAIVGYPACRRDPEMSRSINVEGARNVVTAAAGKIPIIFASTGSTYGKMIEDLCTETSPLNPVSDYGRQKADAEKLVQENKEFVIYRFATAFGVSPRMRLDLLPNDFTYKAVREKTIIVYEKNFMRAFVHVRDMARAFLFALEQYEKMRGEIYNVGSSSMNCTKEDICRMILRQVDYYLHFAEIGHDLDQRDYLVSYDKLEKLGFRTEITMEEGLRELIKAVSLLDMRTPYSNL